MKKALAVVAVVVAVAAAPSAWKWLKRAIGAMVVLVLASCAHANTATLVTTATGKANLVLRVMPQMHLPPVEVFLVAELIGGEPVEKWYCPNVVWTWPDGTESSEEGDCLPWDRREEFPRFWRPSRRIMVGIGTTGHFFFAVRLEKPAGKTLAAANGEFWAPGDVSGTIAKEVRAQ